MSEKELPKTYDPTLFEKDIYQKWEESGMFNPDNYYLDENSGYFSLILPPPNVTGVLHLGHALTVAYEDLMVRYNRLLGKRTLYLPGADHAAIATQAKVERLIKEKEGKTRHDFTREEFFKRINEFAMQSKESIQGQIRSLGASCDWSREKFTLDSDVSQAVKDVFVRMYNDGLIYRGDRIVNWCPQCQSTISDDEVEYAGGNAKIYTFKYSADFPIAISTTRPETKLADTGLAVHTSDERYAEFVGKTFPVDFAGGVKLNIKVFADHRVEKEFGTGAVGVTPAHSQIDWQFAQDHDLPIVKLINQDGMLSENGGTLSGLSVKEARKEVVKWLKENDLLIEEKDVQQNLSVCYRCHNAIEPMPLLQWFVGVEREFKITNSSIDGIKSGEIVTLKKLMRQVVENGQIEIIPDRFNKIYFKWIDELRDWCISRQIMYGHRLPVWYNKEEVFVGHEEPQGLGWTQDNDTLDTWFSSGMWTFSTLGWPNNVKQDTVAEKYEQKNDFERFHPTNVLETGYDILFFWVARMILMSTYAVGEIPFKTVYLHGMVRDEKNQKMSKSAGNAVDPLEMIAKYGSDALRLSMLVGTTPGNDVKYSEEKTESARNLVNKLYNISRYILSSVKKVKRITKHPKTKTLADEWILNELNKTTLEVSNRLDKFEFSQAGEALREFTWNTLADWYLEIAKIEEGKDEILLYILERLLILWHPFAPFITEHIWSNFGEKEFLMSQSWPQVLESDIKKVDFDLIQQVVSVIRNMRSENKIEPVLKLNCLIVSQYDKELKEQEGIIKRLGRLDELKIVEQLKEKPKNSAGGVFGDGSQVYLLLEGIIDLEKEKARLEKEIDKTLKELTALSAKLDNEQFVKNAPWEIVEEEKARFMQLEDRLAKLRGQVESLG